VAWVGAHRLDRVFSAGTSVQVGAVNLCAGKIMRAFMRDPKGGLPLSCTRESRCPGFVLPEGATNPDKVPAKR
jgi:hypothetical protein